MALRLPHELEARPRSLTSLSTAKPPLGSGGVPVEAELAAVDDRLELDADFLVAGDVLVRAA